MITFEAPPASEVPKNARARSFPAVIMMRTMMAVMTLLMAIAAVALVSANESAVSPSTRTVLACGDTPGFCPNPPSPTTTAASDSTQTNNPNNAPQPVSAAKT